jgi:hypothetical protein
MQSKMFVFIGFRGDYSIINLEAELESLNRKFSENSALYFTLKEELISTRLDDVSYSISFLKSEREISDWIQIAKDFKLSNDINVSNFQAPEKRYDESKRLLPNLYDNIHHSVTKDIFVEINKISDISNVAFQ